MLTDWKKLSTEARKIISDAWTALLEMNSNGLNRKEVKSTRLTSNNGGKKSTMAFLWSKRYDLVSLTTLAVSYSIIAIIFKSNKAL